MSKIERILIVLVLCLMVTGCATKFNTGFIKPYIVEPYKAQIKESGPNLARVELVSLAMAGPAAPEVFVLQKGYDLIQIVGAPFMRPANKHLIEPYVFRPLNYVTQDIIAKHLIIKPIRRVGKLVGLVKDKPTLKQIEWFQKNTLYTLWDERLYKMRDPFHETWMLDHQARAEEAKEINDQYSYYVVQKDDCLWNIAESVYGQGKDYPKLAQINDLQDPYILSIDQVLMIPMRQKNTQALKAPTNLRIFKQNRWTKVGGDPYKGTWQQALKAFNLPENIKEQVKKNIIDKDFDFFHLKTGLVLNQVTFGQNTISDNVLTDWPEDLPSRQMYLARDFGANDYHVIRVSKCGNWAWWKEATKAAKKAEVEAPTLSDKPLDYSFKPVKKKKRFYLKPNCEMSSGGFMERFEDNTDVYGRWHIFSFYPFVYEDSKGRKHQLGFAIENVWWKGTTGDKFAFEGGKNLMLGLAYKLNTPYSETYARIMYGKRKDKGYIHSRRSVEKARIKIGDNEFVLRENVTEKYRMEQESYLISFYLSHERWRNSKWFRKIRFYTFNDFDISNRKQAWHRGHNDETGRFESKRVEAYADNKDMLSIGFWLEIYDYKSMIRPNFGFEVKYYAEGNKTGFRPGFGIYFLYDAIFIGTNYTFWNKHFPNSWGAECWVDFWKIYKLLKERRIRKQAKKIGDYNVYDY